MKTSVCLVLLLCVAISLPIWAQTTSATDQTTAATSHETATGQPPLGTEPHNFWDGDQPGLAWLVLHPFASHGYVRRQVQAISDRVDELNQLTSDNGRMIQDVDSRAQQGIQLASTKVTEADQHATDAASKAQMAEETASTTGTRTTTVATVVDNIDKYKAATQTVIRFRAGQTVLSKKAKEALDEMAMQLKDQKGYVIEVQGFSVSGGQAGIASSQRIAESVQRYLVLNHDVPSYRIYVIGMGNAPVTAEDGTTKRGGNRVEVSLLKNDLDQLASEGTAATTPDTSAQPK